jgi:hypothetical protein
MRSFQIPNAETTVRIHRFTARDAAVKEFSLDMQSSEVYGASRRHNEETE